MNINRLDIDGFGVWSGMSIEGLSPHATLFYGPNEAGKTTLMHFMRTVFYGYNAHRRRRYYPPLHGEKAGGSMQVTTAAGRLTLKRTLRDTDVGEGPLTVSAADGSAQSARQLSVLLEGVDEAIYNNVFAIGLSELQELGSLNDTDAAEELYNLTAGLDRVSLGDVMRELDSKRHKILGADKNSQVAHLLERRKRIVTQMEDFSQRGRNWGRLAASRNQLEREIADLEDLGRTIGVSIRLLETAHDLRPTWQERRTLEARLAPLADLRPLAPGVIAQLDKMNEQVVLQQKKHDELYKQRKELVEQAQKLPINEGVARNSIKIEAMREHEQWIGNLLGQIRTLEEEIDALDGEIRGAQKQLGMKDEGGKRLAHVNAPALSTVKRPAKVIKEHSHSLAKAQKEAEAACEEATHCEQKLKNALDRHRADDLETALKRQGELVTNLRRRADLGDKCDELEEQVTALESRNFDLLEQQASPMQNMPWVAGLFAVGVMLVLTGLMGGALYLSFQTVVFLVVLGLGALGLAILSKNSLEQSATDQMGSGTRQLELLKLQLKKAREERDELDRDLPSGSGSLEARLKEANEELAELEALLPLETQRREALARAEEAEQRAAESEKILKSARNRWKHGLRAAGLPETLSPSEVRKLMSQGEFMGELKRRVETRQEELQQRRKELALFSERIGILMAESELEPKDDSPLTQLAQLGELLEKQRQQVARRDSLRKQARHVRKQQVAAAKAVDAAQKRRLAFLAKQGAEREEELRELAAQHALADQLRRELSKLTGEVAAAIAGICNEETLRGEIEIDGQLVPLAELKQRLERANLRKQEMDEALKGCYERRGTLVEQMKQIANDRRLAEAQLDLDCIDEQLKQVLAQWQVLATTHWLLMEVRRLYEAQRQPETLKAASQFLSDLSGGYYTRIWTPFGERELMIDDMHGRTISVELLSRGTREAVFLALRLSLIDAYGARGAMLPVILDDVLVNFDVRRAKAAALVLRDFAAKGHQILMFTCHEHIMKIFKAIKVEVRELPRRDTWPLHIDHEMVEPVKIEAVKKELPIPVAPPPPAPVAEELKIAPAPVIELEAVDLPDRYEPEFDLEPLLPRTTSLENDYSLADSFLGVPLPIVERPSANLPIVAAPPKPAVGKPIPPTAVFTVSTEPHSVPQPKYRIVEENRGFTWDEPAILWDGEGDQQGPAAA